MYATHRKDNARSKTAHGGRHGDEAGGAQGGRLLFFLSPAFKGLAADDRGRCGALWPSQTTAPGASTRGMRTGSLATLAGAEHSGGGGSGPSHVPFYHIGIWAGLDLNKMHEIKIFWGSGRK